MLECLLWIISAYALCMLAVHVAHAWNRRRAKGPACRSVVIITYNQQHQVEWVIRSMLFCNWLRGKPMQLQVIDTGSSDLTVKIISRLARCWPISWQVVESEMELDQLRLQFDESTQVIDLNHYSAQGNWLVC